MSGVKIEDMKEIGSTIRCTDSVKFNGQTVESMKVSTKRKYVGGWVNGKQHGKG